MQGGACVPDRNAALPQVLGPPSVRDRDMIGELDSPCAEFRIVIIRISGRRMYEAFRVRGKGTLYSLATADLNELHAVLREACPEGT
jgi:hypothetical protein